MHDCNIWSIVFPISSKNEFNGLRFTLPAGIGLCGADDGLIGALLQLDRSIKQFSLADRRIRRERQASTIFPGRSEA